MRRCCSSFTGAFAVACAVMALTSQASHSGTPPVANPNQRTTQPQSRPPATTKIDKFLNAVQAAGTLHEVNAAFDQSNFSPSELEQLRKRLEATPALQEKITSLQSQAREAAKLKGNQNAETRTKHLAALNSEVNRRRITAYQAKFNQAERGVPANTNDPNVRCKADAPTISQVSPVTPGVSFVIRGMGLGAEKGSVDISTGGLTFAARATAWNSCAVVAELSGSIAGVRSDSQAVVILRTSGGRETRGTTNFQPVLDVDYEISESLGCAGGRFCTGCSEDFRVFRYQLNNDWFVVKTETTDNMVRTGGVGMSSHGEIKQAPPTNVPNGWATTTAHAGASGCNGYFFAVGQTRSGPKGLSPR